MKSKSALLVKKICIKIPPNFKIEKLQKSSIFFRTYVRTLTKLAVFGPAEILLANNGQSGSSGMKSGNNELRTVLENIKQVGGGGNMHPTSSQVWWSPIHFFLCWVLELTKISRSSRGQNSNYRNQWRKNSVKPIAGHYLLTSPPAHMSYHRNSR